MKGAVLHMGIHGTLRYEPLRTNQAYVGHLPRVRPFVYFQGGSLGETLAAVLANVRFLPGVHPEVLLFLFLRGERLTADLASERFVSGVHSSVEFELLFARDLLPADVAQHRGIYAFRIVVSEVVPLQAAGGGVVLLTDGAIVLDQGRAGDDLPVLRPAVRSEEPGEHEVLPAYLALERFFSRMEVLVLHGVRADRERLVADFALVAGGAFVSSHVHLYVVLGGVAVVAYVAGVLAVVAVADGM